jgi:hypothetical protein
MAKVFPVTGTSGKIVCYAFNCPGCDEHHSFNVDPAHGPVWVFNGNEASPTFSPSLLVRSGCKMPSHKPGDTCWCNPSPSGEPWPYKCYICHSFVKDGKIEFLSDCTHAMAGQTVELPDIGAK